jgi:hypothetical protein
MVKATPGHLLTVGSTLVMALVMGLAVKATAGIRGQTVRELVRVRGLGPEMSVMGRPLSGVDSGGRTARAVSVDTSRGWYT